MGRRQSFLDLSYALVIGGIAVLAVLIIVSPVVIALMTSFTECRSLKFPPTGFSFGWYEQLFDPAKSRPIHRAASNSLEVAATSTTVILPSDRGGVSQMKRPFGRTDCPMTRVA